MPENDRKWIRNAGLASSIGILLVVSTVIGYALGNWLDKQLGTAPWLMLVFTILGIIAGFVEMLRIVDRMAEDEDN